MIYKDIIRFIYEYNIVLEYYYFIKLEQYNKQSEGNEKH